MSHAVIGSARLTDAARPRRNIGTVHRINSTAPASSQPAHRSPTSEVPRVPGGRELSLLRRITSVELMRRTQRPSPRAPVFTVSLRGGRRLGRRRPSPPAAGVAALERWCRHARVPGRGPDAPAILGANAGAFRHPAGVHRAGPSVSVIRAKARSASSSPRWRGAGCNIPAAFATTGTQAVARDAPSPGGALERRPR